MNIIFRAVKEQDLDAIYALACQSGVGLTTLPKDKALLKKRLMHALNAFTKPLAAPDHEYYLFVLEDIDTGFIAGTAAIESKTGVDAPFYSYRYIAEEKISTEFSVQSTHEYLSLSFENEGQSEICTLYLTPEYRRDGNGLLLSLARFLFMYNYPERFTTDIIAELRGVSDEHGHSPFWDAVGQHFFHMSFTEADQLTLLSNKQFIADLMPRHPIYLNLLNTEARAVIGKPHPSSLPAMNILLREGFYYGQTVDIFDAGPTLKVPREKIRTIVNSKKMPLCIVDHLSHPERVLLSNAKLDFRATLDVATLDLKQQACYITPNTAHKLNANNGDIVSISSM